MKRMKAAGMQILDCLQCPIHKGIPIKHKQNVLFTPYLHHCLNSKLTVVIQMVSTNFIGDKHPGPSHPLPARCPFIDKPWVYTTTLLLPQMYKSEWRRLELWLTVWVMLSRENCEACRSYVQTSPVQIPNICVNPFLL